MSADDPTPTPPLLPEDSGLHAPGPLLEPLETRRRWTPGRIAIQVAGLLIGLALFAWAISMAMSPKNADAIAALRRAHWPAVALLVVLSAVSIALNGLMFWVVLRPLKRLSPLDTVLTNAIAVFLAILPFKLGLLVRVAIHHRRDGVSFKDTVSWFAAISALALSVLLPLAGAGLWRGTLDALWWVTALGGMTLISAAAVLCGRMSERLPWLARLSLGSWRIVRHPGAVIAHAGFRIADIAVLAGRFLVAATIAGQTLAFDDAVLLATVYFFLSAVIPTGNLGFREMGVTVLAAKTGLEPATMALVALVVTAGETSASFGLGSLAWLRLRPDRLIGRRGADPLTPRRSTT
jgi:uncharacterized membrane protein YbhN (UPF0104 family)